MRRSPEIEAVFRRLSDSLVAGDSEAVENLFAKAPYVRLITAIGEWWTGYDEIVPVALARTADVGVVRYEYPRLEGYEAGDCGWAAAEAIGHTATGGQFVLRQTGVFALEAGNWRVVQWHLSVSVPSVEIFGQALEGTLDELVSSLGEEDENVPETQQSDTVTVMFTDIEDSTYLSEHFGDKRWGDIIADHFALVTKTVNLHGGTIIKRLGDGTMAVFGSARAAIDSAIALQKSLADAPVRIRIGIHTGDSQRQEGDYYGTAVNKAARIAGIARGGEIIVSAVSAELAGSHGLQLGKRRTVSLKGLDGNHEVVNVDLNTSDRVLDPPR